MRSIVDWIVERENEGALRFYTGRDWMSQSYQDTAEAALGVAAYLRDLGITRGDRIALVLPTCPEFPKFFFGALAVGAIPTVIAPAGLPDGGVTGQLSRLRSLDPVAVVAETTTLAALRESPLPLPRHLIDAGTELPLGGDCALTPPTGDDTAIIQFTSGSSSLPRAVRISSRAVIAHVHMLRTVFHDSTDNRLASFGSWLPLHHDMGLIGTFLTPLLFGQDSWLMRPEHFVRRPLLWLELFGRHGVNHSAMPNFAVERVVRLVGTNSLQGMDFSQWRTLIVGSDRINFTALRAFHELLAPHGLSAETVKPGYGMAETTLAITVSGLREMPTALAVDHKTLTDHAEVEVLARCSLTGGESTPPDAHLVVSCGRELPGAHITVVDSDRLALPDGQVGELAVWTPGLFSGYLDEEQPGENDVPTVHYTGDLGFRSGDEIYVLGRMGNAVKVNGAFVTAEDIELMMAQRLGIHHDKISVVLRDMEMTGKVSSLVVFQQRVPAEGVETALGVLRRMGLESAGAALITMAPLAIPRTSSGKPRRVELWNDLVTGVSTGKKLFVGVASPLFGLDPVDGHAPSR
ncbi:AMP-binding protein [Nocardia jejuensis]|uniref:AMP-binding protein n=1 Tax=Nocardia jejuensis TaxID=328049 RepID=UPI00082B773D|nr:AMP-binding protein [Nocardia jejuensis]